MIPIASACPTLRRLEGHSPRYGADEDPSRGTTRNPTFAVLLDQIGLGAEVTAERLARCKVAVFGLEAHGAHLARMLVDLGVGSLLLVDPFPFESAHLTLTPIHYPAAVGQHRQAAVAQLLDGSGIQVETAAMSC